MTAPDQPGHDLHRKIDMVKKLFETGAQIVETRFAIRRDQEAVLRAFAVTGKTHIAFPAGARQGVAFVLAELHLLR
mgnify:CR=1 FL=1